MINIQNVKLEKIENAMVLFSSKPRYIMSNDLKDKDKKKKQMNGKTHY